MIDDPITLIQFVLLFIFGCFFSCIKAICIQDKLDQRKITTCEWYDLATSVLFVLLLFKYLNPAYPQSIAVIILFIYLWFIFVIKLPKKFILQKDEEVQKKWFNLYSKLYPIISIPALFVQINVEPKKDDVSEEDIMELINASTDSGNMEEEQQEFIENIFDFDDTDVEEICTHRSEVISLDLEDTPEQWHQIIMDNRHTFYPIYEEDEDDIVGVLDTRDYFRLKDLSRENVIKKAVDKPFYVPENMIINDLFKEMQQQKKYFAIVLDEYGGMTGIVTLHDIVETILGDMSEEDDEEEPEDIIKVSDTKYIISGIADIEEVQEMLKIDLPIEEYETFGGYILGCYGKLPDDGSKFDVDLDTMHVHINNMKNHRIEQMIVYLKENEG